MKSMKIYENLLQSIKICLGRNNNHNNHKNNNTKTSNNTHDINSTNNTNSIEINHTSTILIN